MKKSQTLGFFIIYVLIIYKCDQFNSMNSSKDKNKGKSKFVATRADDKHTFAYRYNAHGSSGIVMFWRVSPPPNDADSQVYLRRRTVGAGPDAISTGPPRCFALDAHQVLSSSSLVWLCFRLKKYILLHFLSLEYYIIFIKNISWSQFPVFFFHFRVSN